jgi:hypothetical protein
MPATVYLLPQQQLDLVTDITAPVGTDVLQADQNSMPRYDGMDLGDALCYTSLGAASKFLAVKFFVGGCEKTVVGSN